MSDGRKLMIVEDEGAIRHILEIKARGAGFEVRSATNGRAGLECLREWSPDIIVTDQRMPEMSGVQLIHAARKIEALKNVPIILLTGSVVAEYSFSLQLDGLEGLTVLRKPFSPRELFRLINDLVTPQDPNVQSD